MGGGEGVLSSCVGLDPEGLQGGSKAGVATGVAAAGVSGGWWATSTSGLQYCLSETLAGGGVVGVAVPSASCAPAGAAVDGNDGGVEGALPCVGPGRCCGCSATQVGFFFSAMWMGAAATPWERKWHTIEHFEECVKLHTAQQKRIARV